MKIILASSSIFRKQLLGKLGLKFNCVAPNIDETHFANETPRQLVLRLAEQKARAIKADDQTIVIASDQVAVLDDRVFGKPITHANAIAQLQICSGKKVEFLTSIAVLKNDNLQIIVENFSVYFRKLNNKQIENYLQIEKPYNCAGSFKSDGLGIVLFEKLSGEDPNSLVGLPLIKLTKMLENIGIYVI